MTPIEFFVAGIPRPKGSMKPIGRRNGHVRLIEQIDPQGVWKKTVALMARHNASANPLDFPVAVDLMFYFPKPKKPMFSTPATTSVGDIDKLSRNVLDALTQGLLLKDDSRVIDLCARKRWSEDAQEPGVYVRIREVTP